MRTAECSPRRTALRVSTLPHLSKTAVATSHTCNDAASRLRLDALQSGSRQEWAALFEPDAELFDDGQPRSLESFTRDALGHEHFVSIDRVGNHSLELISHFHSDKWREFRTYFKFQLSPSGRIRRLDIGQAD
jgi:hypothetical protein